MTDIVIKGVHNRALLRLPNNENDFWRIEHIYQGETSPPQAVRVPNVHDIVIDTTNGYPRWLEVQHVDETTLIPTLVELASPNINKNLSDNRFLGVGPGYQSELWRLYLDQSVVPHVFAIDSRMFIKGKDNTKYKIFKGTDTSSVTGKVISMNFNTNGELISEDLPLELVAFAGTDSVNTNLAVKTPRKGWTTTSLQNGDIVTLVAYSDLGIPTSYNVLMVHNTALDRSVEASTKYVTTISIDSPFLDKTENNTLIFPMNTPRDALAMMGVISYSDGSQKRIPIDGTRLQLHGLDDYVPMKKDQTINLVLQYNLPDGELALNASTGYNRFIAVNYFARTLQVDGSYSVCLFPIPTYVSDTYGWSLRYLLYTLDRDVVYDVTNIVENGANTNAFSPKLYNETQNITVSLDLQRIDTRLKRFIHVQSFKISLLGKPTVGTTTPWLIEYETGQTPQYGANIVAKGVKEPATGRWRLDLTCGATTQKDWLERLYYRIKPLHDKYREVKPPTPTHFVLTVADRKVTYPISAWNQVLTSEVGGKDGYGIILQWVRQDGNKVYQLGAAPVCLIDISEGGVIDHAGNQHPNPGTPGPNPGTSTVIDIEAEVKKIADRGASRPVVDKYRGLLTRIKQHGLLKYEDINGLYQRIREHDLTPAAIANDVILLEGEVNEVTIGNFNRNKRGTGITPPSMEGQ